MPRITKGQASLLLPIVAVVVVATAIELPRYIATQHGVWLIDFKAFYCAASAVAHGSDPYLTEPLYACESTRAANGVLFQAGDNIAIPSPLPPYAIAAFIPFSMLPFETAAYVWLALLLAAFSIAVFALQRITGMGYATLIAATALSNGVFPFTLGQISPIAVASVSLCALFLQQRRYAAAAIASAVGMIEPHIGLPVCISLCVWSPRSRLALLISGSILVILSLVSVGLSTNVEYFSQVLPAHIFSELAYHLQYSLSAILYQMGTAPSTAIRLGELSYLLMTVLGVATAGVLAKRSKDDAFVAAIPAAFVMLGGTFLHSCQISAAVPAALVLLAGRIKRSGALAVAALLLAIPWEFTVRTAYFVPLACAFVAWLAWRLFGRSVSAALAASLAAALFAIADNILIQKWMTPEIPPHALQLNPHDLAEVGWAIAVQAQYASHNPGLWLGMAPTVIGIVLLVSGSLQLAWLKPTISPLEAECSSPAPILT